MDASQPASVRVAEEADALLLADILTEAFADDPVANWTLGGPAQIAMMFKTLTKSLYLKSGFGHVTGEEAASLWLGPGVRAEPPPHSQLRLGWSIIANGGLRQARRAIRASTAMAESHPHAPHYYLFAVGVRRRSQWRGLGGRIIREGLARADRDGAPAYLENSRPRNAPLYERCGFETLAPLPLPAGAPPLVAMLRKAQPRGVL